MHRKKNFYKAYYTGNRRIVYPSELNAPLPHQSISTFAFTRGLRLIEGRLFWEIRYAGTHNTHALFLETHFIVLFCYVN